MDGGSVTADSALSFVAVIVAHAEFPATSTVGSGTTLFLHDE